MMKTFVRAAAALSFSLLVPAIAAAEPSAREAFVQGQRSAAAGRWEEARQAYQLAWSREHSADVAAALGHVELELGLPVRAAEHLSFALEAMANQNRAWPEPFFDLVEARRLVTTLRVSAKPGATVIVDGTLVGQAPIARPIFVDSGRHTLRVELAGFKPAEEVIEGQMGEEVHADFGLVRITATPAPGTMEPAPPPALPSTRKNPWIIGAGAVAGTATLAVGIGYGVAAVTSAKHQEQHNVNAGVIGAIGGGVLAATITYALWPSATPPPRTGFSGAPVVLDKGGGFMFNGSF